MSLFESMNRKQRRKFQKMKPEEQAHLIEAAMMQKISPVMSKEITKAMITGTNLVWEQLYSEFVEKMDFTTSDVEYDELINQLLSLIRTQYLRIQADKLKGDNENEVRGDS